MKKFIAIMLSVFLLSVCTSCGYSSGSRTIKIGILSGSYWGTPSNDCYHVLDNAIERFKSENIGVEVEYVNGIAPDAYSEWLAQQIIMGTEPDVFFVLPEDFDLLVSSGVLADLDTMISNDDSFNTSAYYDVCLTAGQSNGSQYALPYESVPTMMFVNMTLLKENGIPIPDNNWTWDDFYDICERVTDVEARQFGVYGYDWIEAL